MTGVLRCFFGVLGNVISVGLFVSPLPKFQDIVMKRSSEDFCPFDDIYILLNCLSWVLYGLPVFHFNNILLVPGNFIGILFEGLFLGVYFKYATPEDSFLVGKIFRRQLVVMVTVALVAIVEFQMTPAERALIFLPLEKKRSFFLGSVCVALGFIAYPSLIDGRGEAIFYKNVIPYASGHLSLACFCNAVCWACYACLPPADMFILIPHCLGGLLSISSLYAWFRLSRADSRPGADPVLGTRRD